MVTRPEHKPIGDPCSLCGLPVSKHRDRSHRKHSGPSGKHKKASERIIGIDGEGRGRFPHEYNYFCARDESGEIHLSIPDPTTESVLDGLLSLPLNSVVVGYALTYDWTKILASLPNKKLYSLFHEETRQFLVDGRMQFKPVKWRKYRLNYMNRRMTISKGGRKVTVWDVFRFFATKFTSALKDWKVADAAVLDRMGAMKDKRSEFDKQSEHDVQVYCQDECLHLALLTRALIDAHLGAGLTLKHYFGAGSTATALLTKLGTKEAIAKPPARTKLAVASAFFGGRFENSCIGPIGGPVYNYDIASAYPYHTARMPCLLHGTWQFELLPKIRAINQSTLALIHWRLPHSDYCNEGAWGPFPVRTRDGTILFPTSSKEGGWVWKEEWLAGKRNFTNVETDKAWLYHTDCSCEPFAEVPQYYLERLKLGKDGKGLVIKLGLNSIYGKLAQSRGFNPPFQCYVWAGNITSNTRAQLIDSLSLTKDPWDILMFATDGVWSRKKLKFPEPEDTGTKGAKDYGKVPLGAWESKEFKGGVFAARPGIYFPLEVSDEAIKEYRARGLGKSILLQRWRTLLEAYEKGASDIEIKGIQRFIGAKSALTKSKKTEQVKRSANYGEWIEHTIKMSFSPFPKRERVEGSRLIPWQTWDEESQPYIPGLLGAEGQAIKDTEQWMLEQPDGDYLDNDV